MKSQGREGSLLCVGCVWAPIRLHHSPAGKPGKDSARLSKNGGSRKAPPAGAGEGYGDDAGARGEGVAGGIVSSPRLLLAPLRPLVAAEGATLWPAGCVGLGHAGPSSCLRCYH